MSIAWYRMGAHFWIIPLAVTVVATLIPDWSMRHLARSDTAVTIKQVELGNVFTEPDTPKVRIETTAGRVTWCAYDFWGRRTSGEVAVPDGSVLLELLPVRETGLYQLHVTSAQDCANAATRTTFALLPKTRRSDADITYSVQTHFSQGWSPEIVPLIGKIGVESVRDAQRWQDIESFAESMTSPCGTTGTPPSYGRCRTRISSRISEWERPTGIMTTAARLTPLRGARGSRSFHHGRPGLPRRRLLAYLSPERQTRSGQGLPGGNESLCRPEGLLREQINPVRRLLDTNNGSDKQIWITEMGWKSETMPGR